MLINRHVIPDHNLIIDWASDLARTVLRIFGRYQRPPATPRAIPYRIVSAQLAAYYAKRDRIARHVALTNVFGPDHNYTLHSVPRSSELSSAYRSALRQLAAVMPPPE